MGDIPVARIKELLADERTRPQALDELGMWAKNTCLLFGSEPSTAYAVALQMVSGIGGTYEQTPTERRRGWRQRSRS